MSDWRRACALADLPPDAIRGFSFRLGDIDEIAVALVRRGDRVFAVNDRCPHRGAPFSQLGLIDEQGDLVCGWHNWVFGVEDGKRVGGWPRKSRICTYAVEVRAGEVLVDLGGAEPAR